MKHLIILITLFVSLSEYCLANESKGTIIPLPKQTEYREGKFQLPTKSIGVIRNNTNASLFLINKLSTQFKIKANTTLKSNQPGIVFNKLDGDKRSEAYTLSIQPNKIEISATGEAGLFYGVQSLLQLFEAAQSTQSGIPCQMIQDDPRFEWRAFMLDEARYFKGEKVVLQILDVMASLKMNTFHWHLTDDQGWRYESKLYPMLTEVGSKRTKTQIGGWNSKEFDYTPHEGFYSQDQIRRIVKYANDRHIKVVPEIEMPGHASAAVASYPWLGSKKETISVSTTFGKHYTTYNVTDPNVMGFLQDLVAEAMPLFNTDIIHIGGDEVRFNHWEENPEIVKYKEDKGYTSFMDIQIEATNKMSYFIAGKKGSMMGWNEILGKNLHTDDKIAFTPPSQNVAPNVIVQFWKGELDEMTRAAKEGYRIVNSYHLFTYLDYDYQSIPLSKAYSFEPIPEGLQDKYHKNIIGLGCQMWGEWTPTAKEMYKLAFPRIGAYAEVGWSDGEKDFKDFTKRLQFRINSWNLQGIPVDSQLPSSN